MTLLETFTQVVEVVAALVAAPIFLGWVNQCRAWLQNRSAPSVLLPYRNIRKLFHKDALLAENASPLFRVAPYVVFGAMSWRPRSFRPWPQGCLSRRPRTR